MLWRAYITSLIVGYLAHIYNWTPEKAIIMLALGVLFAILEYEDEKKK